MRIQSRSDGAELLLQRFLSRQHNHSSNKEDGDHENSAKIPVPFSLDHRTDTRLPIKRKDTAIKYSTPLPWPQDRPPDELSIMIKSEEGAHLKRGPGKYENRNFEQSRKFWIGLGEEPKAEQKDA